MKIAHVIFMVTTSLLVSTAAAESMESTNYAVDWDVFDGGGAIMMSSSYTLMDSVAQPTPIGTASSSNYVVAGGFLAPPDTDQDSVRDFLDNCSLDPNNDQFDSNGDGYGNICDLDLNNDNIVNFVDVSAWVPFFNTVCIDADEDFNGDGNCNFADYALFTLFFLQPPGPSGLVP